MASYVTTEAVPTTSERLYAWYVLAMLLIVYVFNWFDRYLLIITMESIKRDLGISDTALGLLTGIVFSAVYSVAGLFVARWADLTSRRSIITGGLVLWSVMTAACGMAGNFLHLAIARFGVGIGESACSPPSHSLISDYFKLNQRATALAIFSLGLYVGLGLGLSVGGWLNEQYGWRTAFIIAGAPGVLLALWFRLTVKEPPRGRSDGRLDVGTQSAREVARFMLSQPAFVAYTLGTGFFVFAGNSIDIWGATFVMRVHGHGSAEVGEKIGTLGGIAGVLGTMFFAMLADRLAGRDLRWYLRVAGAGGAIMIPFIMLFLFAADGPLLYVWYFIGTFCGASYMAPTIAITQRLMPVRMRAVSSAVILLSFNIVGIAFGNLITGMLSDGFAATHGNESIRYALAWTQVTALIGLVLMIYAIKRTPDYINATETANAH